VTKQHSSTIQFPSVVSTGCKKPDFSFSSHPLPAGCKKTSTPEENLRQLWQNRETKIASKTTNLSDVTADAE
jgi:hypothetical protein